ncbi:MAG: cyclophilin-like family protein [Hyphomicrobium sp.]
MKADPKLGRKRATKPADRCVEISAGNVKIRAQLLDTPTADRVWHALPLHSTAKTWGEAIHFETHVESGLEHTARMVVAPGDICFWVEDDRIIIVFGRTPISRPNECRLPRPCNLWARALDDVRVLKAVRPGEKVSVTAANDRRA